MTLPLAGQVESKTQGARAWPLPRAEEIALAESAGPTHLVKDATIYVLEKEGFVKARPGSNGFTCLVARSLSGSQEPMCFDAEGAATLLPRMLDLARLRAQGKKAEEVQRVLADGFLSGKYRAPKRVVVSYMLSCENWVPVSATQVIPYPPHVMFYIPNVTNADIGSNSQDPWMPFVVDEGSPYAIVIVRTGENPAAPRCAKAKK
jgi:hypothetical protein